MFRALVAEHLTGTNAGETNKGEAEELPSSFSMVKCHTIQMSSWSLEE